MISFFADPRVSEFRRSLKQEFDRYLELESARFTREDCLKIDLHCHDRNSDIPDELWGRILGLPETWLKTRKLVKCLHGNGCDVVTITNHNNARSCWELLDKGQDVLVGAEFTCHFPDDSLFVHVLTYGFNPQQEVILQGKRRNIFEFLRYTTEHNLPVVLPHPLYFYTRSGHVDLTLFEKLAVMFQRFEVLNGQRDQWQAVLTLNWVQSLTAEKIHHYAARHKLNPADFGVDPEQPKILTGGSDDHMGIFAGESGSYLYVPDLQQRLQTAPASELALEALRAGRISPYGHVTENQKLNIALLDYFSQVAVRMKDPGLLRLFFHRGEVSDKVICFTIANLMLEMQKQKHIQKFFGFVHVALRGKKLGKIEKWSIRKDYRFCVEHIERIARSKDSTPEQFVDTVNDSVSEMYTRLCHLIIQRLEKSSPVDADNRLEKFSTEEIARRFEVPCQVSELIFGKNKTEDMSRLQFSKLVDNLSFPLLINVVLAGTVMASTRLLYKNRHFLNEFAGKLGRNSHPRRALYLTDTLLDKNGVSSSLSKKLEEIQRTDMPIDFLICHPDAQSMPHLHVVRPLTTFNLPDFGDQEFRVPDLLEISRIFYEGGYDRVVCSTEGPMAPVSMFLKFMFNVPAYFFMHTDWLEFIKNTTDLSRHERDRVRRLLRFFYKQYEGVFVLNNDHREWLSGHEMQLEENRVHLTAHHTGKRDPGLMPVDKRELFADATADTPVLLFASRVSPEKGVFDLPEIYELARQAIPDLRIVIAGSGPAEHDLKMILPDARYLGWVSKQEIARLYAGLDLMVFPSRFDTFGNVVLEAFVHGMPVAAYNCKGPGDIIQHGTSGYLVDNAVQMSEQIVRFFSSGSHRRTMQANAVSRSHDFQAEPIMQQFLVDLGLAGAPVCVAAESSVA